MEPNTNSLCTILIEQVPVYAAAIAAIFAAYAAYRSWLISKNSFNLQKAYIHNHDLILRINSAIEKLEKMSIFIIRSPLALSKEEHIELELLFTQIKELFSLLKLTADIPLSLPNIDKFSSLGELYEIAGNNSLYLENLINQLKKYRNTTLT
tara:strand:- start:2162 stop:2617 length:456 start_codon:yes stop_codon:yes gene_type:complete